MQKPFRKKLLAALYWIVAGISFVLPSSFTTTHTASPGDHYFVIDTSSSPDLARRIVGTNRVLSFRESKMAVYDSLHLEEAGLSRRVFNLALKGMEKLVREGRIRNNILSIADFSQPSINKRLYVIDLDNFQLLFQTLVSHGMRSGKEWAQYFSNKLSSHKSSLGFYVTGETYSGNNGYSLKLMGVERGINDNAARRAIVVHGADYVSEDWVDSQGYIGRSFGCPAVPVSVSESLIDDIKEGTCLFIYHPSAFYLKRSRLLH